MFISKGALGVTLHPFIHISGFFLRNHVSRHSVGKAYDFDGKWIIKTVFIQVKTLFCRSKY